MRSGPETFWSRFSDGRLSITLTPAMDSEWDETEENEFETDDEGDEYDEESEESDDPLDFSGIYNSSGQMPGFGALADDAASDDSVPRENEAESSTTSDQEDETSEDSPRPTTPPPAIHTAPAPGDPCCISINDGPLPDEIMNLSVIDDGLRPVLPVARLVTPIRAWLSARDGRIVVVQEYCNQTAAKYARETWQAAIDSGLTWPGASPEVVARFVVAPTRIPESAWADRTCIDCTFKLLKREMEGHWTVEQMNGRIDKFADFDRRLRASNVMIHPGSDAQLARDVMLIDGQVFMMDPTVLLPCPTGTSFSVLASPYEEAFEVDVDAQPLVARLIRMIKKGVD